MNRAGNALNLARFSRRSALTLGFGILIGGGGFYALPRFLSSDTLASDDGDSRSVTRSRSPTPSTAPEPEIIRIDPDPEPIPEPVAPPSPSPLPPRPRTTHTDNRLRVRQLAQTSPEWDDRPDFFWVSPIRSDPGIKAFWVQIDGRGWLPIQPRARNWRSPIRLRPGRHEFFVVVEYVDGIVGPPTSIYFTILGGLPDFVFGEVILEPTNPKVGDRVKVSAFVRNVGRLDFVARNYHLPIHQKPIRPDMRLGGRVYQGSENAFDELRVGEEVLVGFRLPLTPDSPGEHEFTLSMNLDPILDLRSPESDYNNNQKEVTYTVT